MTTNSAKFGFKLGERGKRQAMAALRSRRWASPVIVAGIRDIEEDRRKPLLPKQRNVQSCIRGVRREPRCVYRASPDRRPREDPRQSCHRALQKAANTAPGTSEAARRGSASSTGGMTTGEHM